MEPVFTGDVSVDHEATESKIVETLAPVSVDGKDIPQDRSWLINTGDQLKKHIPHFQALGMSKGDISAMRDRANDWIKEDAKRK